MKRLYEGFKTGIFIGIIISLIFSLIVSEGTYYPMNPHSLMGEIYAQNLDGLQTFIVVLTVWGMIGILFAFGDMIFSHTDMSVTMSTVTHFSLMLLVFFPLAILAGWFPFTAEGLVTFITLFVIIYTVIWLIARTRHKTLVDDINEKLNKGKEK